MARPRRSAKPAGLLLLAALAPALATQFDAPLYDFLSRPDIRAPRLTIDALDRDRVAPGYIFMSPFSPEVPPGGGDSINYHMGPMIFDNEGELIWSGFNETYRMLGTMGFSVCSYQGEPHLCKSHYVMDNPINNDIMNSSYDVVRTVFPDGESGGHPLESDLHEFNVINASDASGRSSSGPTALISSSVVRKLDPPYQFDRCNLSVGWIKSSVFQEVSLAGDNKILWQWDSYDHVPINDSVNCPGYDDVWMTGAADYSPFDHFHLNAADKDAHGDYYLSARHTSTLYKISGVNGSIIWQIGRNHTDFQKQSEVPGIQFDFAFQHNLRVQPGYPGADLEAGIIALSLFDNANDDYDEKDKISPFSAGKIILVNENNRTAVLKEAYTLYQDEKHQLATNQGSFQLLPNGNRIIGGGNIQEVIEWQPGNSQPVFRAHWGDWEMADGSIGHKINSYRSQRFEWHGKPSWTPALLAFAPTCGSGMTGYVSWNGATEVASWNFMGAASKDGTFIQIGSTNRTGFESKLELPFTNYVLAVALDAAGNELGRSLAQQTSVPNDVDEFARAQCNATRCTPGFDYKIRATRECPPVDLSLGISPPPPVLHTQSSHGVHCDPCFGTYKRWVA